jgi:hypothetical protein
MPVFDTSCFMTTVRNESGARLVCSFLPPNGKTLAVDEEYSFAGDPISAVARGDALANASQVEAFLAAVSRGELSVVNTPAPLFEDATTHLTKSVRVNSGALGVVDPCFATSVS